MTNPTTPELPHGDPRLVAGMFGRIARRYDLLNRVLSFGFDGGWRRFAADKARLDSGDYALDVCCGTGDLAIELSRRVGVAGRVAGLDITHEMLVLGNEKLRRRNERRIDLHEGDAMRLPYAENVFQAATMAFGGRNVPDLEGAFREMGRVVRPGGRIVFLELNRPRTWGFRQLFDWYFHTFSPLVGGLISGDRAAYEYLPRSVDKFEAVEDIALIMSRAGLVDVEVRRLMFGVAVVHAASVP
jgi:demethylmenaquinone methyltransferase/2-methoxy-6-polyprenyl-1,4-benzoquinol methylase